VGDVRHPFTVSHRFVEERTEVIMKKLIALAFASIVTVSAVATAQQPAAPQGAQRQGQERAAGAAATPAFKTLTRAEFDALLKEPGAILLLDVRRPDELQTIGGFPAYLSIQSADVEKSLAFIPKDRTIITVSNHAGRAGRAAALLAKNGFKVAGAIGAQTYEEEGGTLVKIAAPAPKPAADAAAAKAAPGTAKQ
jgi:rhodanese-related sulfurtransferase